MKWKTLSRLEKKLIIWNIILTVLLVVNIIKVKLIDEDYIPFLENKIAANSANIERNYIFIDYFHGEEIPHDISISNTKQENDEILRKCDENPNCRELREKTSAVSKERHL